MTEQRKQLEETIEVLLKGENPLMKGLSAEEMNYWNLYGKNNESSSELRPSLDVITAICWTTNTDSRRNIAYMRLSQPGGYFRSFSFEDGQMVEMHAHTHIELTYIVRGQVTIRVEDRDRTLQEGELLLINSGTMHAEYQEAKDATLLCLDLDDSFFELEEDSWPGESSMKNIRELINRKRSEYSCILFSPTSENGRIEWYLSSILREFANSGAGRKRMLLGMAERIVDLLPKNFHMQMERKDTWDYQKALISDIHSCIRDNCSSLTVAQIGQIFHYSPDYLNRLLRREEQTTLSLLIQKYRMEEAMKLLLSTGLSVEDIAERIGYHNLGFFYRKFRNQYGRMPGEVRAVQKNEDEKADHGKKCIRETL